MDIENRQDIRFKEIGHIVAPDICSIPGIIDDISASGCKVHYPFPVEVELENEYEVKLSPSQNPTENPLNLIVVPQWAKECEGQTQIGFKILYSPDAANLQTFINHLESKLNEENLDLK